MDQPVEPYMLDGLAAKVGQYCFILQNLTGDIIADKAKGPGGDFDYDTLRAFLHEQGQAAYEEKVRGTRPCSRAGPRLTPHVALTLHRSWSLLQCLCFSGHAGIACMCGSASDATHAGVRGVPP